MSDPSRYVIVDLADYSMMMPAKRTNLPDAPPSSDGSQHIHVTRHPDGTITATPMERAELGYSHVDDTMEVWLESAVLPYSCMVDLWVDCPTAEV